MPPPTVVETALLITFSLLTAIFIGLYVGEFLKQGESTGESSPTSETTSTVHPPHVQHKPLDFKKVSSLSLEVLENHENVGMKTIYAPSKKAGILLSLKANGGICGTSKFANLNQPDTVLDFFTVDDDGKMTITDQPQFKPKFPSSGFTNILMGSDFPDGNPDSIAVFIYQTKPDFQYVWLILVFNTITKVWDTAYEQLLSASYGPPPGLLQDISSAEGNTFLVSIGNTFNFTTTGVEVWTVKVVSPGKVSVKEIWFTNGNNFFQRATFDPNTNNQIIFPFNADDANKLDIQILKFLGLDDPSGPWDQLAPVQQISVMPGLFNNDRLIEFFLQGFDGKHLLISYQYFVDRPSDNGALSVNNVSAILTLDQSVPDKLTWFFDSMVGTGSNEFNSGATFALPDLSLIMVTDFTGLVNVTVKAYRTFEDMFLTFVQNQEKDPDKIFNTVTRPCKTNLLGATVFYLDNVTKTHAIMFCTNNDKVDTYVSELKSTPSSARPLTQKTPQSKTKYSACSKSHQY